MKQMINKSVRFLFLELQNKWKFANFIFFFTNFFA